MRVPLSPLSPDSPPSLSKRPLPMLHPIYPPELGNHKKPLLVLAFRVILLFLLGTSIPFSSTPVPPPPSILEWPIPPPLAMLHTLSLLPKAPLPLLRDIPIPLSPSTSLSSLNALAASSFAALSARLAARPASDSETCSSSIVLSNFSILSRPLAISS
jgi:hypothetical protein